MATRLYRDNVRLDINILAGDGIKITENFKNTVDKSIGDRNYYQYIGKGDQKISLTLFLESKDKYDELISFFEVGTEFALELGNIFRTYNLDGDLEVNRSLIGAKNKITNKPSLDDGSYIVKVNLTSATNFDYDEVGFLGAPYIAGSDSNKSSILARIKSWASSAIDFTGNTNSQIASFTGKFAEYATAITQLANGIAAGGSMVSAPISSVKNSVSSVIGGVSSIVSGIGTAINAIKQVPDDIDGLINAMLDVGEQFSNLFNSSNKSDQVKTATDFLIETANTLIYTDSQTISQRVVTDESDSYSVAYDPEIIIEDKSTNNNGVKNNDIISVLILSSILLALYEQSTLLTRWNKKDLDGLLKQTETLYEYIITKNISSDVRNALMLARNNFFTSFNALYKTATNIVTVTVLEPKFLSDVVYSVNGNFDYYTDTKKLNNILGSIVQGEIQVISNG